MTKTAARRAKPGAAGSSTVTIARPAAAAAVAAATLALVPPPSPPPPAESDPLVARLVLVDDGAAAAKSGDGGVAPAPARKRVQTPEQAEARRARLAKSAAREAKFQRAKEAGQLINASATRKLLLKYNIRRANKGAVHALTSYASSLYRDLLRREIGYVVYRGEHTLREKDVYAAINAACAPVYK